MEKSTPKASDGLILEQEQSAKPIPRNVPKAQPKKTSKTTQNCLPFRTSWAGSKQLKTWMACGPHKSWRLCTYIQPIYVKEESHMDETAWNDEKIWKATPLYIPNRSHSRLLSVMSHNHWLWWHWRTRTLLELPRRYKWGVSLLSTSHQLKNIMHTRWFLLWNDFLLSRSLQWCLVLLPTLVNEMDKS